MDASTQKAAFLAVPIAAVLVLLAGAARLLPPTAALAIAVGGTGVAAAALLIGRARFFGLGALATGLATLVPRLGGDALWAVLAFGVVTVIYAQGALLLPGAGTSWPIHLRRTFDGLGLGVSLGFAGYMVLPARDAHPANLPIIVVAATGVTLVTVTVLRIQGPRARTARRAAGAVLVLVGLAVLTTVQVIDTCGYLGPLLGLPIVLGLALTAAGGPGGDQPDRPGEPRPPDRYLTGYPLLAVPAGVGVIAALWHLVVARSFDTTGVILGIAMVAALVMRELLVVRDIRHYAGQLQTAEAHFRSLVAGATDLTLVLDTQQRITWQSPAGARLFGFTDGEVIGRRFRDLIHPEDVPEAQEVIDSVLDGKPPALVAARLRDGGGQWRETESTITDQRSVPEVAALVVHVRDIGERRHLERTLHKLHSTDQLTGLSNRRALMRELLAFRRQAGQRGTLIVIDLHGLAEINDSHSRETGDAVLTEVGRRIRALLDPGEVPARLGGDEFAVLTADGAVFAYALATRITTALKEPYDLPGSVVDLHTSVGLAELAGGADSEDVLRHADLARRRAQQLGHDRIEWYDPDVEMSLNRRMDLEKQILGAADRGELDLVYQPVVALAGGQPVGVEALLRWRHPELGTILPGEILPIARAVGISARLDEWVLDAACKQLSRWADDFWLSINVAPRELLTARFGERVEATLRRYGLAPERLVIEVAEAWVAEDVPLIVASLAGLRKLGVRAALDDFGAGQASLSHLRRLPVDVLKLDQSLVKAVPESPQPGPAVIDVVVSLGRRLGLEIVAKGLETDEQIERAAAAGCRFGQGFALGRPAPAERTEAYLESRHL